MSSSLVKRSLELFEDDTVTNDNKRKKKWSGDCMQQISTKKKGVKKELRKLKQEQQRKKGMAAKNKKSLSALEQYREREEEDMTEANVQLLQRLSDTGKTQAQTTSTILEQHRGRLAKDKKSKEKKKEESTVFTDRDFDIFEEEYDFFS